MRSHRAAQTRSSGVFAPASGGSGLVPASAAAPPLPGSPPPTGGRSPPLPCPACASAPFAAPPAPASSVSPLAEGVPDWMQAGSAHANESRRGRPTRAFSMVSPQGARYAGGGVRSISRFAHAHTESLAAAAIAARARAAAASSVAGSAPARWAFSASRKAA
jgi:hypothetical protein